MHHSLMYMYTCVCGGGGGGGGPGGLVVRTSVLGHWAWWPSGQDICPRTLKVVRSSPTSAWCFSSCTNPPPPTHPAVKWVLGGHDHWLCHTILPVWCWWDFGCPHHIWWHMSVLLRVPGLALGVCVSAGPRSWVAHRKPWLCQGGHSHKWLLL